MKSNQPEKILSDAEIDLLQMKSILGLFLNREQILEISQTFLPIEAQTGDTLFQESSDSSRFLIIIKGQIQLFSKSPGGEPIQMGLVTSGRTINLYSVVRGLPFQYSGRCSESVKYLDLPLADIKPLLDKTPELIPYLKLVTEHEFLRSLIKEIDEIGCSKAFRVKFVSRLEVRQVEPHTWLTNQGTTPGFCFFIVRGMVQGYQQNEQKNKMSLTIPARTWVGWKDCLLNSHSRHSFRTTDLVELIALSRDSFTALSESFPEDVKKYSDWIESAMGSKATQSGNTEEDRVEVTTSTLFPDPPKLKRRIRWSYPWVRQENMMDCGPACLAMISKFYENEISIQYWRSQIFTNREGTSLFDLAKGAERNGFTTHGLYIEDLQEIESNLLPAIAVRQYHFVVIYKITLTHVIVGDPSAGVGKMTIAEFLNGFENAVLVLQPNEDFSRIKTAPSRYSHYLSLFQGYTKEISLVLISSVLCVIFSLFTPFLMQIILDEVLFKKDLSLLYFIIAVMAVVTVCQAGMNWIKGYYIRFMTAKFDFRASSAFLRKMFSLPYSFFALRHIGDFTRRLSEMERLRGFLTSVALSTFLDLLTLAIYGVVLFFYSKTIAIVTLLLAPILVGISMAFSKKLQSSYLEAFTTRSEEESLLNDLIRGIPTIKALNAEVASRWRLEEKIVRSLKATHRFAMLSNTLNSMSDVYGQFTRLSLTALSAYLAIKGDLTPGQVVSIGVFVNYVIGPFFGLAHAWSGFQELKSAMSRLNDIFLSPSEQKKKDIGLKKEKLRGDIEFKDVWFRYGGDSSDWVLAGVSFKIEAGQKIAIAGPSGSGKSTVANLLLRLHEPTQGQILIDGRDYRDFDLDWLRKQVGLVLQDSHLFYGSIAENIAYSDSVLHQKQIEESAKAANAHSFIMTKSSNYSYVISHGGMGLSGGEKQRISCARTFYQNPAILILDEATSSLDGVAEKELLKGILNTSETKTVLSIAHRYTTARFFEYVLLMNAGKIVDFGTHSHLLNTSELYGALFGFEERKA